MLYLAKIKFILFFYFVPLYALIINYSSEHCFLVIFKLFLNLMLVSHRYSSIRLVPNEDSFINLDQRSPYKLYSVTSLLACFPRWKVCSPSTWRTTRRPCPRPPARRHTRWRAPARATCGRLCSPSHCATTSRLSTICATRRRMRRSLVTLHFRCIQLLSTIFYILIIFYRVQPSVSDPYPNHLKRAS